MAAANDNQGLKIAVAALVMLVFILGVTNYFAFSSASQNFAKAEKSAKDASEADTKARAALDQANDYRLRIGYDRLDDPEAVKTQMTKDLTAITTDVQKIEADYRAAIAEVKKAGEPDPELDQLISVGSGIVGGFVSEPNENKKFLPSLQRLKDLMANQAHVMRALSLDYRKLRRELASANGTNSVEVAKIQAARDQAVKERQDEIARFKTELQGLYDQITTLQNNDKDKTNSITDLTNKLTDETNRLATVRSETSKAIQLYRDKLSLQYDTFSGKAFGQISYIDHNLGEVRVNVTKKDGARPLMRFTVFDRSARGLPGEKPKGSIELISVGDPQKGERDSLARIIETKDPINPINRYDQIYSPARTKESSQRFALIGRMDMNRDGIDDRADLIRLIEQSGGLIEYDLPPPGVDRTPGALAVKRTFDSLDERVPAPTGRASGRISSLANAYVVDERPPLTGNVRSDTGGLTPEAVAYAKERSEATKEARANGVPPMPLERLLSYFGWSAPTGGRGGPGTIEMKNQPAIKAILKPRVAAPGGPQPAPAGTDTPPAVENPAAPK